MKQISSVDLYFLTKEFSLLENQRIDSFYFENQIFYIKFYIKGKGASYLTNKLGQYVYLDKQKPVAGEHPINFIQYLRKYLKNSYMTKIEQLENERILRLEIEKMQADKTIKKYFIFLELFSGGNIILTDSDLNIMNSLIKKKFKDRSIMVGNVYSLPPKKELSIYDLDRVLFKKNLKKEINCGVGAFIATRFGLGGKFANEICILSDIDKSKLTTKLTEDEVSILCENLEGLFSREISALLLVKDDLKVEGNGGKNNSNEDVVEEYIDFFPFQFEGQVKGTLKKVPSFNDAIKSYYNQFVLEVDKNEQKLNLEFKKLQKRLKTQEDHKAKVLIDYEKYNNLGNIIYSNYVLVEEILNSINKAAKEKGWDYIKKTIKENPELDKRIVKLDYKKNEITLNLE